MEDILYFLGVEDLDSLHESKKKLSKLNEDDHFIVHNVIDKWEDEQAIANILLYPDIIDESYRWQTIEKGLESYSNPYYILAAIYGLQNLKSVPNSYQEKYFSRILRFCETKTDTLAVCASVTATFLATEENSYLLAEIYPVFNDNVNHNFVNHFVQKYDIAQIKAFAKKAGLPWGTKRLFIKECTKAKRNSTPLVKAKIPNLKDA
ncbi:hypothetical protein [Candidatus Uabimicrobium sp. HlEnr_7]|uniref:hypothetical protein n=1 Tax=Candidatus Uabimicrobium helgolandensis TaxID=3095367 RepID=UPI003558CBF2